MNRKIQHPYIAIFVVLLMIGVAGDYGIMTATLYFLDIFLGLAIYKLIVWIFLK